MTGLNAMLTSLTLLLLVIGRPSRCFNVDIPSAATHAGPPGSYFGFSVDVHKDRGTNWLLVGAPNAQTPQPGVTRGGAVFRCSPGRLDQNCTVIPFDVTGNNNASGQQIDNKTEQWFGATVRSSGPNGAIVACAPRYVWYSNNYKRREPVGTCFVARDSFREYSEYSPCRTSNWGYHRQGSCQAGFGAALSPDGQRLFIGSVGSWYWQGQLYSINTTYAAARSPVFRTFVTGQMISQNMMSRLDVLSTAEGSASEDDSYLGYSAAVGDLDGDGRTDVAVGMPRGANLTGKVVLFTTNLTNIYNITGLQLGAYFGYCLAVVDLNGDGLQDVVIGAPLHTNFANTEGKFETGRVYVYYQGARATYRNSDVLEGDVSKARFGLSVTSLGDINLDGFNDIAVGAPYDGPSERGAVYVFHGTAKGIRIKSTQTIYAEEVSNQLSTFGFSLAGGLDMDGNEYPDLLVGAYDSDRVVYMRSRPVVQLNAVDISYDIESKQIDLESKTCNLLDRTPVACVPLTLCLEYSGQGVESQQELDIQLFLDAKNPKNPRMHFLSNEGKSTLDQVVTLSKGQRFCRTHMVYARPSIRDKLTPIEAEVRYSLRERTDRRVRRSLPPVLGTDTPFKSDAIVIQKNCGPDNICVPDMQITATPNMNRYTLGSGKRLEIDVSVFNGAEDAFEATLFLQMPKEVDFVNIDRSDSSDTAILCSPPTEETGYVLHCELGNPLPAFKKSVFRILLQPNAAQARESAAAAAAAGEGVKSSLDFYLEVNSTNPEDPAQTKDNRVAISLPIQVETDLSIRGVSDPDVVRFNLSAFTSIIDRQHESQVGPPVTHVYELGNRGPSEIVAADVYILWPTRTLSGKELLYLVEQPLIDGPVTCSRLENFNPQALRLESDKSSSSRYVSKQSESGSSYRRTGGNRIHSAEGKQGSAGWNRTTTYTRYNPDGTVETSVSRTSGTGSPGSVKGRNRRRIGHPPSTHAELKRALDCGATQCSVIQCHVGPLTTNNRAVFRMRSRVWAQTIADIDSKDLVISSKMVVRITELPYGVDASYLSLKSATVTTSLDQLDRERETLAGSWWIIVLSVLAGVLLLLLLIYVLYKLGFFKRKRPASSVEQEPLNSHNGHMQKGDEAL